MTNVLEEVQSDIQTTNHLWLKSYWPYFLATLLCFLAKLPTLNNYILFIDEPTYLIQASRLNSLETFFYSFSYRVEPKFQLGLLPDLLALLLSPSNAILIIRLCGLLAVTISAWLLLNLSKLLFGGVVAGFFSLILWLLLLNHNTSNAAPLLEYFQTPLLLVSFWLFVVSKRPLHLFLSGFSLGLAILVKPTALVMALVIVLALLGFNLVYRKTNFQRFVTLSLKQIFTYGSGIVLPVAFLVLPYLIKPETLSDLKFNLLEVSSSYSTIGNKNLIACFLELLSFLGWLELLLLALTMAGFGYFILKQYRAGRGWSNTSGYQILLLMTGGALLIGYAAGQSKYHYVIPIAPFLMLFVGYNLVLFWRYLPKKLLRITFLLTIVFLVLFLEIISIIFYISLYFDNGQYYKEELPFQNEVALVSFIETNSKPQDYIWVYYNSPELYWQANRRPATSDAVGSWLVHLYTPFWFERTRSELERDAPSLIIGIDQPRYSVTEAARLTELPVIKDWLAQNYNCDSTLLKGATLCRRKSLN